MRLTMLADTDVHGAVYMARPAGVVGGGWMLRPVTMFGAMR